MVKCPNCGNEEEFEILKTWKYRFYNVKRVKCKKCGKIFNHYYGLTPKSRKVVEFTI